MEGRDAPVLSVSLEHAVVDVSEVEGARAGAPVYLLASEPAAGPSLAEVAARQGRSPLEVLVSLTGRAASNTPAPSESDRTRGRRRAGRTPPG